MRPTANRRLFRLVLGACVVVVIAGVGVGASRLAVANAAPPELTCTPAATEFGEPVLCEASGATDGFTLEWSDGLSLAAEDGANHDGFLSVTHAPAAIGPVTVSLHDADGRVVASSALTIAPDIALVCETEPEVEPIYKLVPADNRNGWDYVYVGVDGAEIGPGHPDHPLDPGLTPLAPVKTGEANETGVCQATSAAEEALGGSYRFTITTDWHESSIPFNGVKPWSKHHWIGTQPGTVEAMVTVNDHTASERQGVYLSGCT